MEAQGKALIQQKAELEAVAQAQQQELGTLQQQVTRLRKELQGWELEKEVADVLQPSPAVSDAPMAPSPEKQVKNSSCWFKWCETGINWIIFLCLY